MEERKIQGEIIPPEKRRKITKEDIEDLKKDGVDHWAFDEMDL